MFQFTAKFLQKPTTTAMPDEPTGDAAKTATNNHLQSRLLQERQRRARNEQQCVRCRWWRLSEYCGLPHS